MFLSKAWALQPYLFFPRWMYRVSSQNSIQLLSQVFTSQKQNRVQQNKTKKKKGGGNTTKMAE